MVFGEESELILSNMETLQPLLCQFLHDRVQQAAYKLIDSPSQRRNHLSIGRLLIQNTPKDKLNEQLFDILYHFKMSKEFLDNIEEKTELSQLFYQASQRAKESTAYSPGFEYAHFGIELLPLDMWDSHYELTLNLHKQLVECEYLRGNFQSADEMYSKVVDKCKSVDDKVKVSQVKIRQYETQQRYGELLETCKDCLQYYGIHVPHFGDPSSSLEALLANESEEVEKLTRGREISDLINNKPLVDSKQRQILSLLVWMWAPAFCIGSKPYLALVSTMMAKYTIQHGNTDLSSLAFTNYSFVLPLFTNLYRKAYEYGKLGCALLEVYPNETLRCRAYFTFGTGAINWVMPLHDAFQYLDRAMEAAIEYSDIPYACYSSHHIAVHRYLSGVPLSTIAPIYQRNFGYLKKMSHFIYYYGIAVSMPIRAHIGWEEEVSEEKFMQLYRSNPLTFGGYYIGKLECFFWKNSSNFSELFKCIQIILEHEAAVMGFYKALEVKFISTMIYLTAFLSGFMDSPTMRDKKSEYWDRIQKEIQYFEVVSAECPPNNEHKLLLLNAQMEQVKGNNMEAIILFQRAQRSANQHSFLQYEALANELAGRLWHSLSMSVYAKMHFTEAIALYGVWGSKLKVSQLCSDFPQYLADVPIPSTVSMPTPSSPEERGRSESVEVDLNVVSKALSAISGDTNLEDVLRTMMKIIIENSGAQRGLFLLLDSTNELLTAAEGNADNMNIQTMRMVSTNAYPMSIINYSVRTRESVILADATLDSTFNLDPYIVESRVKSVQSTPIIKNNVLKGIIYLENSLLSSVFDDQKQKVVDIIARQMTMYLENAKFGDLLESEKRYRALSIELEAVKKRLEEYIDTLCHELRNPLNGIYGNKEILSAVLERITEWTKNVKDTEERKILHKYLEETQDILGSISISAEHLRDIVDTVLNISRLEKQEQLQNVTFNPREIVEKVVSMFKARISEKELYIRADVPQVALSLWGDKYRLTQVVINLVSNAIKFTHTGGITISLQQEIQSTSNEQRAVLHFKVEDTGIGLSEEEIPKLFKPFSQANSSTFTKYGGSGLGLQLCQKMVKLMGGDIQLTSKGVQAGTTCTFHVVCKIQNSTPSEELSPPKQQQPVRKSSSLKSLKPEQTRVLITEDNTINQLLLRRILEQEKFITDIANNGKEALEKIISTYGSSKAFQIVLMDLEMPIMNGFEATRKIRQFEAENNVQNALFIVGVSANARDTFSKSALDTGMDCYITKPFQKKDILNVLQFT